MCTRTGHGRQQRTPGTREQQSARLRRDVEAATVRADVARLHPRYQNVYGQKSDARR